MSEDTKNLQSTDNGAVNQETNNEQNDGEDTTMVKVVQQKNLNHKWIKYSLFAVCMVITVIIIVTCTLTVYINNSNTTNNTNNVDTSGMDYVLPNDTIIVSIDTNTSIMGQFYVNAIHYEFKSVSNETSEFIQFTHIEYDAAIDDWTGFKINHLNEALVFELYHTQKTVVIAITETSNLGVNETKLFESFLGNIVCAHFVELSVKLGSLKYVGSKNKAIRDIHSFASWIWKYETALDESPIDRDYINGEIDKVNELILGEGSNDDSINANTGLNGGARSLLSDPEKCPNNGHGTGSPYNRCNNPCFGRCGNDCNCWAVICGTCNCYDDCHWHDWYCSCDSFWGFWCINALWVDCGAN